MEDTSKKNTALICFFQKHPTRIHSLNYSKAILNILQDNIIMKIKTLIHTLLITGVKP